MTNNAPPPLPHDPAAPPPPPAAPPATAPPARGAGPLTSQCPSCGAQTAYAPGTKVLRCSNCGAERTIEGVTDAVVHEHSYDEWTSKNASVTVAAIGAQTLACRNCGATTETTDLSGTCQFCSGALVATTAPAGLVPPEAVIPFHVDQQGAQKQFGEWIGSRWFAPNALKKVNSAHGLTGTYIPHWTFDAHTETDYTGQRGEHYYVTRTRTVSDGQGGQRTETYQEQQTAWHHAAGHVSRDFDDVLVVASHRLEPKKLDKMGPWTLGDALPFQQEYLTGYSTVRYDVDPQVGADQARATMKSVVEDDCRDDIGGDEQRVSSMDINYSEAMFKLVLMPLWIASYLYNGKTWQVLVNANTGEVVGDRPYSKLKIVSLVIAILVVVGVVAAVVAASKGSGGS